MGWLESFIESTAWKIAEPQSFSLFHLILVLIGFPICIFLAVKLRNLSEKGNRILLFGVGAYLIISEIYKQLFYYFHVGDNSYCWWIFPFQLCSVPMYLCIISSLVKSEKIQKGMLNFMFTYNLLGGFMAFVEPSGVFDEYLTITIHSIIWHFSLIFIGVYLGLSKHTGKTKKDFISATYTFLALCALAFSINLIFRDVSEGDVNMFFVGPSNSSLAVFKQISEYCGWYVSTILYIPSVCLGAYLIFLLFKFITKEKNKPFEEKILSDESIPESVTV